MAPNATYITYNTIIISGTWISANATFITNYIFDAVLFLVGIDARPARNACRFLFGMDSSKTTNICQAQS